MKDRDRKNNLVYWSPTPEQGGGPYVTNIVDGLRVRGWVVEPLSVLNLAISRKAIIHIQWPEHISRGRGAVRTVFKHFRAVLLLVLLRLNGHKVVVTAHNRAPHGKSNRFDAWFRRKAYSFSRAIVVLVSGHADELRTKAVIPCDCIVRLIPHPLTHMDSIANGGTSPNGTLVVIGQIHPYHLIESFLDALDANQNSRAVLVVGRVGDKSLLERLTERAKSTPWLKIHAGYATEEELGVYLSGAAAIVALQRNTFNSGGPYVALPLSIPVVISSGDQSEELERELGAEWVFALPESIVSEDVAALESWIHSSRSVPDLTRFDMVSILDKHVSLYELLQDR